MSLTRRGLDAPGVGAEDAGVDVNGNVGGDFGADAGGDFGAGVGEDFGADSGGPCGGAGVIKNVTSQSVGIKLISIFL